MKKIRVTSRTREQLIDITREVQEVVAASNVASGVVHLWSMHTTCALTVNEGADPDVASDAVGFMQRLIPKNAGFEHREGNADAHIKTSLYGPGLTLLIDGGKLVLGTWQAVFLAEWDGPRPREIAVQVSSVDHS